MYDSSVYTSLCVNDWNYWTQFYNYWSIYHCGWWLDVHGINWLTWIGLAKVLKKHPFLYVTIHAYVHLIVDYVFTNLYVQEMFSYLLHCRQNIFKYAIKTDYCFRKVCLPSEGITVVLISYLNYIIVHSFQVILILQTLGDINWFQVSIPLPCTSRIEFLIIKLILVTIYIVLKLHYWAAKHTDFSRSIECLNLDRASSTSIIHLPNGLRRITTKCEEWV